MARPMGIDPPVIVLAIVMYLLGVAFGLFLRRILDDYQDKSG